MRSVERFNKHFFNNINIEKIVFAVLLIIVFSYNFHVLWLLYDVLAIGSIFFFLKNLNFKLIFSLLFSSLFFLFLIFKSDFHLISFFSVWDNIKHVFPLFMLLKTFERHSHHRIINFLKFFGYIIGPLFLLQFFIVIIQYFAGFYHDNISGTFGTGASHSICYFCLMCLAYYLYVKRSNSIVFLILILSSIMNFLCENLGFYILAFILILVNLLNFKNPIYILIYGIIIISIIVFFEVITNGIFLNTIAHRLKEFISPEIIDYKNIKPSRGVMSILALMLGGFLGAGPGCFSSIYSLTPWLSIEPIQIDICSFTILIAEYGIIGTIVWIFLYFSFLRYFFRDNKYFIVVSVLFLICFFYNKLLNDERIIFLFIFILAFLQYHINRLVLEKQQLKNV